MSFETGIRIAIALVPAYLLGAIPFALIVGKVGYKLDLREHGSGNLGATNVVRTLGWRAGLLVLVLDMGKGAVAVQVAKMAAPWWLTASTQDWVLICAAMAAIMGHSYSPYIKFRGGKGVATAAGALAFITPLAFVMLALILVTVSAATRMVSLGSITAAIAYPIIACSFYGDRRAIVIMSFVAAGFVLWRHRTNMVRIVRGQESKIGRGGEALRKAAREYGTREELEEEGL